jgi:hypothetical protein
MDHPPGCCMRRSAYNMVLHKFGDRLYDGLVSTITAHLQNIASQIDSSQNEQFLADLNQRWNEHNKSMQMIRDILMVCSPPGHLTKTNTPTHMHTHTHPPIHTHSHPTCTHTTRTHAHIQLSHTQHTHTHTHTRARAHTHTHTHTHTIPKHHL